MRCDAQMPTTAHESIQWRVRSRAPTRIASPVHGGLALDDRSRRRGDRITRYSQASRESSLPLSWRSGHHGRRQRDDRSGRLPLVSTDDQLTLAPAGRWGSAHPAARHARSTVARVSSPGFETRIPTRVSCGSSTPAREHSHVDEVPVVVARLTRVAREALLPEAGAPIAAQRGLVEGEHNQLQPVQREFIESEGDEPVQQPPGRCGRSPAVAAYSVSWRSSSGKVKRGPVHCRSSSGVLAQLAKAPASLGRSGRKPMLLDTDAIVQAGYCSCCFAREASARVASVGHESAGLKMRNRVTE